MTAIRQRTTPAHVQTNPRLGTWITVRDGCVDVHVGKVELGQGILTALHQIAADALALPLDRVRVRPARTDGPDQGTTAGSLSVFQSTPALRYVGAAVRRLAGPADGDLTEYLDRVRAIDPDTDLTTVDVDPAVASSAVGTDVPRLDIPDKVLGRPRFLSDLRPEGLLHARVLRPPSPAATLGALPGGWSSPGVSLVPDGSFLGVIGVREDEVDRALVALAKAATWDEHDSLPDEDDLAAYLRSAPSEPEVIVDDGPGEPTHTASYSKPYLAHGSIAPSCAMARWSDDGATVHVWSHSQGIHALRRAIAAALPLDPSAVSVEHVENAGCYGHNAADDAAFDAVLLARTVPGRPVLLRWTRRDELTWGPLSPAMTSTVSARLVDGLIEGWSYDVWSQGHTSRPGYAGQPGLLAMAHRRGGAPLPPAADPPAAAGFGGLRNAIPLYDVGRRRITGHRVTEAPLRTSAMRALGSYLNVFAIESFMDELAADADLDPVDFRLAHLADPRAHAVVELAARASGWGEPLPDSTGRGVGLARYKENGAWCAVVAEVEVETDVRVRRLTVAADLGLVINPDGARNQLSGGAVQSTSWTTVERIRFDRRRVTSDDWESYPILRFPAAPRVDVHLVDSDQPPLGSGEAAQGPTAAAIANAVHAALGVRVRDLPLTSEAIVSAIETEE
ncbi:molybdopterin cofactor-binding domain-containing protein [Nocardioides sp.]|jgi:CO/xanthine dehydrogenase Mo-binding subunit|uniref:molybdopterin cofactor-binding domain-containing protein n=1 Tax=Nocardioides sp. TaxID=35761 RepID=UPI002F407EBB